MRHIFTLTISLPLLPLALSACDIPDDEAEMQAFDIEDARSEAREAEAQEDNSAFAPDADVIINAPHPVAAQPNQLCRTNSGAILYTSPISGIYVPPNALVRILDYRGPYHYLARYDGTTGQLERSKIIQESCYYW